ncbi:MAG: hypothetical protein GF399_04995 [Candidatus Coatesbacteria bacterium]|nr:hypothetical protein [Candidatus Coatesbacteria bacterium]
MTLKLPHEFRPTASKVGRRTYNLAYSTPEMDPDLSANLDEALQTAQHRPVLVEIVGEGCFGDPSFIDYLLERGREREMQIIDLPRLHGHQEPLSILRRIVGRSGEEGAAWAAELPDELAEQLWLLDVDEPVAFSTGRALRWRRIRLVMELLRRRLSVPTVLTICSRFGEVDHETIHLLEFLFDNLPELRVMLVLSYDERNALTGIFSGLDSYYIRFIPEIRAEFLGEFGLALQKNLSHEQFAGFLAELTPSRCYAEQLRYYFEHDLKGRYDRRLNYPLTPIQLFLSRWQKVDERERRLLLALALRQTPQSAERAAEVAELPLESVRRLLEDLVAKRLCLELPDGYVLSDPSFYTWSVDFSDHQLTEQLHRRQLDSTIDDDGFPARLSRLEHLIALDERGPARRLAVELLDDLNQRALFHTVNTLEGRVREILAANAPVDEVYGIYIQLIPAALALEDADGAATLLEELEAYAVRLDDTQRGRLEFFHGRRALLDNDHREALERFAAAAGLTADETAALPALEAAVECALELGDPQKTDELLALYDNLNESPTVRRSRLLSRLRRDNRRSDYAAAEETISEINALLAESEADERYLVDFELELGRIAKNRGRGDEAHEHLERARDTARSIGYIRAEAYAQSIIAQVHYTQGRLDKAIEHYLDSLKLLNYVDEVSLRFAILNNLGLIYHSWGYLESALSCIEICERHNRTQDVVEEIQTTRYNLALLWLDLGFIDRAQRYLKELSETNSRPGGQASASVRHNTSYLMGRIAERQSNHSLAERLFRRAAEQFGQRDIRLWEMFVKIFLARSLRRQNRLDEAAAFLDEVETAVEELNSRRLELNYLEERAALLQDRADYQAAEERANRALEIADRVGIPLTRFRIYRLLSLIQQAAGRNDEARHSYEAAAEDLDGILADFSREELREGFLKRPQIAAFRENRP